jgi:prophage antirepressor-like protein
MLNCLVFHFYGENFRTVQIGDQVWFVGSDIARILEYKNLQGAIKDNCNPDGIKTDSVLTAGGKQNMIIINEPNLYRLVARSKMPRAVEFEKWIFETVLPEIRKTGGFNLGKKEPIDQLKFPELFKHAKRVELNEGKVPYTHFSMLGEMSIRILRPLQEKGFDLAIDCLPDGSLGKGFCKYLRDKHKVDTDKLETYLHDFGDHRTPKQAKLYPNRYYEDLQIFVNEIWLHGKGAKYFVQNPKKLK